MKQDVVFDFSKLRGKVVEVLGSQNKLAEEMGISYVTLSRKFSQKTVFSTSDIIHICMILDIPKEEIGMYFYSQV